MMSQEEMHARHLAELGFLQDALGELGYTTWLAEKSDEVPFHTLLVDLEPDEQDRPRQMALSFYPVDEDEFANTLLLQYFIALPVTLDEAGLARVREWLPEINNQTVLGHLGITDDQKQLHFRYVQPLPRDEVVTAEAVEDVVQLVSFAPLLFQAPLEALAAGQISLEEARARVAARLAEDE